MGSRQGYIYAFSAYLCWGGFPLFYMLLADIDALETVPWRVLTGFVFCVIAVLLTRSWGPILAILKSPRMFGWFVLSSLLLYTNWQIFVYGVVSGNILQTALGYFINPFVTILVGVLFRGERLRRTQWLAVGIAGAGVLMTAIAYGKFPWIALGLAFSFGLYGAVRKHASEDVDALTGLTVETLIGSVVAIAQLGLVFAIVGRFTAFDFGPSVTVPLLLSGAITAIPLLFFAAGTRRLPLSHMGFIQFMTPILNFLTGYLIFNEEMSPARWVGFAAVWVAVVVLLVDIARTVPRSRRGGIEPPAMTGEIPTRPS